MDSLTAKLRTERQQAVETVTAAAEEEIERLKHEWEGEKQQVGGRQHAGQAPFLRDPGSWSYHVFI